MNILSGVSNAAQMNANFVWLDLTTTQNLIISMLDNIILAFPTLFLEENHGISEHRFLQ